ncbi:MAG: NAD-dependent protein deacylase [Bacilli bacterium]|nr:NAD-dependent protein deacylase [Bacilli bacterium]
MNKIEELRKMIDESNNIVFFGGAGVSTESGIPDFRSDDGLYNQHNKYNYPPEYLLSRTCFNRDIDEFYRFYKDKMNCLKYKPNITHKYLKELEDKNKLTCVITQNIDGLHQKAGSKKVYELHGTVYKNHCTKCNKEYNAEYVFNSDGVPTCSCGGVIKPDVVLYEEALPEEAFIASQKAIYNADMLIVAGTSLTVFPASSLINIFQGKYLVIINRDKTPYDNKANLVFNESLSSVIEKIKS